MDTGVGGLAAAVVVGHVGVLEGAEAGADFAFGDVEAVGDLAELGGVGSDGGVAGGDAPGAFFAFGEFVVSPGEVVGFFADVGSDDVNLFVVLLLADIAAFEALVEHVDLGLSECGGLFLVSGEVVFIWDSGLAGGE